MKKTTFFILIAAIIGGACYFYARRYLHGHAELEKVLTHYANDSLKRKAAHFLIDNMDNKFAYEGKLLEHYDTLFTLFEDYVNHGGKKSDPAFASQCWDSLSQTFGSIQPATLTKRYDRENISSDFLIKEIDTAFEAWQSLSDSFTCNFDLFCQYVLPYRIGTEPLDTLRQDMLKDFLPLRDSLFTDDDALIKSLFTELRRNRLFSNSQTLWGYPISISKRNMQRARHGACMHVCEYYVHALRACGIPATIDFVNQWGNRQQGHTWVAIPKDSGQLAFDALERKRLKFSYKPAKIYRRTFKNQPVNEQARDFVPHELLYDNRMDVSHHYFPTHTLQIQGFTATTRQYKNYPYGVICVFDNRQWRPVDYGKVNEGLFTFTNMIGDVCYIAGYYDHGTFIPATPPFILTTQGEVKLINSSEDKYADFHLTRKYPKFPRITSFVRALHGGVVEAADTPDFKQAQKLMSVSTDIGQEVIDLYPNRPFRPYRYVRISKIGNLAEVMFYGQRQGDDHETELTGRFWGVPTTDNSPTGWQKAIDKDYNSYFTKDKGEEGYVALDLGENNDYSISRVRYIPRSDTNFIIPGNHYRLEYWDTDHWVMAGEQTATDHSLDFAHVPVNRLYILHCLNGGQEERIFTYENSIQCWW